MKYPIKATKKDFQNKRIDPDGQYCEYDDLHKRLDKAAKEFTANYASYHQSGMRLGFLAGAEFGYKEAIKMAKEWMEVKVGNYLGLIHEAELTASTFRTAQLVADFESDMNKLWEG